MPRDYDWHAGDHHGLTDRDLLMRVLEAQYAVLRMEDATQRSLNRIHNVMHNLEVRVTQLDDDVQALKDAEDALTVRIGQITQPANDSAAQIAALKGQLSALQEEFAAISIDDAQARQALAESLQAASATADDLAENHAKITAITDNLANLAPTSAPEEPTEGDGGDEPADPPADEPTDEDGQDGDDTEEPVDPTEPPVDGEGDAPVENGDDGTAPTDNGDAGPSAPAGGQIGEDGDVVADPAENAGDSARVTFPPA